MKKPLLSLIALAALALAAGSPALASDLSLKTPITLSPQASLIAPVPYNPGNVTTITATITVKNNTSSDANFFIAIDELVSARKVSLTVNNIQCPIVLSAKTEGGYDILTPDEIGSSPLASNSLIGAVKKGKTTTVKAKLKAATGYYGPDGNYSGIVTFHCYRYYASGAAIEQFSSPVSVTYSVPSRATLTLSNGTLDFGQLIEGESLGATITVEASRAWDLYVQSQRGGCLQHDTDIYSKVWYTLTIEGEDFGNLTNPTICYSNDSFWGWLVGYNATLDMAVTINEVPFEVEPGVYTDNIWLTIMTR